jgi:hypothetical protein
MYPTEKLSLTAQYLRADPALFLSRQSVLGVFATDSFDEIGGDATYRPDRHFAFGAGLYTERFASSDRGGRATLHGRATRGPITAQLVLGRVADIANGYWSERASLAWNGLAPIALTLEQYLYLYDKQIHGVSASTVEVASAEWSVSRSVRVMLSGSTVISPYASLDTQALVRLEADLGASKSGVAR